MKQLESFFWGILAALGALLFEFIAFLIVSMYQTAPNYSAADFMAFPAMLILAAALEEIMKLIVINNRVETYSLYRSFVFNSICVGLGFAATEIFFIKEFSLPGARDLHSLTMIALVHVSTSAYIGYRVAIKARKTAWFYVSTLAIAALMHIFYNGIIWTNHELSPIISTIYACFLAFLGIIFLIRVKAKLAQ